MQIAVCEDVALSAEDLFDAMARFPLIEEVWPRPGVTVERLDEPTRTGPGMKWRLRVVYRDRLYETEIRLTRFERAVLMEFDGAAAGLGARTRVDLVPFSPSMTRLALTIETRAGNLAGRALLQGLRLRRGRIEARLAGLLAEYARRLERGIGPGA
ncbi:MAG: hypothetical protein HLUCCA24_02020 [Rhodobacteraceae bacterium HLUCCA24]|nr:MAG: hypothetical protein HLUCCA24_02020 [Rhodobacteraceae bacterium HLUCCA24]